MSLPLKTPAVADLLGVTYHRIIGLLRYRKIPFPARDTSGEFIWTSGAELHAPYDRRGLRHL